MTSLAIVFCIMGILLYCGARRKIEWLLNFVMRGVVGTIIIYFVNLLLETCGFSFDVRINSLTVLTCAVFGFPGVPALYGFEIYQML